MDNLYIGKCHIRQSAHHQKIMAMETQEGRLAIMRWENETGSNKLQRTPKKIPPQS